jgi:hypothetical protein
MQTMNDQKKPLSAEAQRALEEAQARRNKEQTTASPKELGGRGGLEPVRYQYW